MSSLVFVDKLLDITCPLVKCKYFFFLFLFLLVKQIRPLFISLFIELKRDVISKPRNGNVSPHGYEYPNKRRHFTIFEHLLYSAWPWNNMYISSIWDNTLVYSWNIYVFYMNVLHYLFI